MVDVEQDLRSMVGKLIDSHLASGTIEWVHGVSNILPIRAVAMLLGLPDGDSAQLKFWSDEGIEVLSGFADGARMAQCMAHIDEFVRYLGGHMDAALERTRAGAAPTCVIDTGARAEIDGDYDRHTSLVCSCTRRAVATRRPCYGFLRACLATHPVVPRVAGSLVGPPSSKKCCASNAVPATSAWCTMHAWRGRSAHDDRILLCGPRQS